MPKSHTKRMRLLGSAAVIGLFGSLMGTAQAVDTKFGEFELTFDTTVSMGASMRVADRETLFLPETNGGAVDPRQFGNVIVPTATYNSYAGAGSTGQFTGTLNPENFDGSINTDDGRLNFDSGDIIGANVKANHDLLVKWRNYTLFARAIGFYDVVMNDPDVGARSQLTDAARGDVGRNYELLDLFVSADYTFGGMPLNIRVGKQVINWGESTFILGGNNVFNPIDVGAFRRPGSEIKEALLPVNAISGSITLPEELLNISLAGYYGLDWEPFELDPSGTPFSGSDVATKGSGIGGNQQYSFVTGSPFSGNRRNCVAAAGSGTRAVQSGVTALLADPLLPQANLLDCTDRGLLPAGALYDGVGPVNPGGIINYSNAYVQGSQELVRVGELDFLASQGVTPGNNGFLRRGGDEYPDDLHQFGLSARYSADWLNGTEFAVYYQKYASRLPFANIRATGNIGSIGFFINGDNTQMNAGGIGARQLNPAGCGYAAVPPANSFVAGAVSNGTLGGAALGATARNFMQNTPIADPGGILANAQANYTAQFSALGLYVNPNPAIGINNMYALAQLNCALAFYQSGPVAATGTTQSFNGAEFLIPAGDGEVFLSYPENIDAWGGSFNTTMFGWGVQGDFTYRHNAPFQVDTDSLTVASLVNGCLFSTLYGAGGGAVGGLATPDAGGVKPFCGSNDLQADGVIENEMFTAQIGTTATFTQSEWFIDAVGADLGIFVTEIGMVYTPGVEDTWVDNITDDPLTLTINEKTLVTQYQNTGCQGTDLPAGGIVGLDHKSSRQCRPTNKSAGLVLLYSLQYNNAFNTGFLVSPTIVYSYDFYGTTAAPYGNYMEDRQAVNLGVTGTLNNNFKVGVSYTNFFGGHITNKSRDLDFASATASYSF